MYNKIFKNNQQMEVSKQNHEDTYKLFLQNFLVKMYTNFHMKI